MKVFVYFLLFISGVMVSSAKPKHVTEDEKLRITVYYEALCPDCTEFFRDQFYPSMVLNNRLHFTDLTLLPYGKAKKSSTGEISCQHGVDECELNAWHVCALENLDTLYSIMLIDCMILYPDNQLDYCAQIVNIDVTAVKKCKEDRSVDEILKEFGEETDKVQLQSVPAIAVNFYLDESMQNDLVYDFDKVFCAEYKYQFNKKLENCA